ncbi:unnamed protein product [Linum tenue]|uniref:Uncharacterized protein n=1 Tax=Linum tenue TaxID=586396 RepID=A0AAV0NR40_9ROSI|nr:unnamed protein product [Linum tenue]
MWRHCSGRRWTIHQRVYCESWRGFHYARRADWYCVRAEACLGSRGQEGDSPDRFSNRKGLDRDCIIASPTLYANSGDPELAGQALDSPYRACLPRS